MLFRSTRAAGTYTITIDGELVDSVTEGNSYTFPAATGNYAGVTHFANVSDPTDTYDPEETVTPTGDISVKSVYTITFVGTDTNGNPLKTGNHYKLRFYYNVDLSEATGTIGQGKGLILKREGYDAEKIRYQAHEGLNMVNGTINTKS